MITKAKANKGITLMALIVTIIVLLILAGISISMLAGNNGILNKAKEATEVTRKATIGERIKLAVNAAFMDGKGNICYADLNTELKNEFGEEGYIISPESDADEWIVEVEDVSYQIKGTGNIIDFTPSDPEIMIQLTLSYNKMRQQMITWE